MKPVICHIMAINNNTFIHQLVKLALYFIYIPPCMMLGMVPLLQLRDYSMCEERDNETGL